MKFIKDLRSGTYKTKLALPRKFCVQVGGKLSEQALISTSLGTWRVKVGEDGEMLYFYGKRWTWFVNEHNLDERSVLVFKHYGSFFFKATLYDASACEQLDFDIVDITDKVQKETKRPVHRASTSFTPPASTSFTFTSYLSPTTNYLYIPKAVLEESNLKALQKKKVIFKMRDWETPRAWKAELTRKCMVQAGWPKFLKNNNLRGLTCTFELFVDVSHFGIPKDAIVIIVNP